MKHSTLILYNGGAYGTYLEWVLTTLTTESTEIVSPLTETGSSHLFEGNHIGSPNSPKWIRSVNQTNFFQFARAHPKVEQDDSIRDKINTALESFDQVIFCYPDQKSILLNINNAFSKIWTDWLEHRLTDPVFAENLYTNWNISPDTLSKDIPVWIKREILSYNLIPSWKSEVEWFFPDTWNHPKCKVVFINDLLYNFKQVIAEIQEFCQLTFKTDIGKLLPYHSQMLNSQQYLNQDRLCSDIIESVTNAQMMHWDNLPIPSQSWIQWRLRELGYEIRCDGLDIFPTTSVHLQELLYKA